MTAAKCEQGADSMGVTNLCYPADDGPAGFPGSQVSRAERSALRYPLRGVEYHAGQGVAVVGTGLRWGDVYHYLDQYNVTVVGGRILQVGVGGLTLGSKSLPTPNSITIVAD
ncbi:hypothetical protein O1611_g2930 [Lasiodiplodia mahajangana]|uniref:Uncharacterized protein n=1 Tax=Lasiodiplodia mahajangana TaxID=1108764 RepID=A0ACC2JT81_9PEZI|nr:hypothetical protein O1611_g2930 [Lasiodiplodia mahajangana]